MEPPDPPLTDGVVTLRPAADRDLGAIERGITDPDVVRWFGEPTKSAREVLELNRARWVDGTGPTFAICGPDDRCVGHVWVNVGTGTGAAVGYWLLPEARGRGLATRAVRLISEWAYRDMALTGLHLVTERGNLASQRVAERSGFQRDRLARSTVNIDGRSVEHLVFRLPRVDASAG
jgi:RimJ/RimL family protein N-acetyltransferase